MLELKVGKVAVTGGLSCGKSSVCRIFTELGAYVVSADEIVHQLLSPETNLGQQVIDLMGSDIITNHQIDRSKIAKKVFNQPTLLKSLEKLLHPAVGEEIDRQYQDFKAKKNASLFVAEIPLLFEANLEKAFDATIAVLADPELCRQRFQKSTGCDKEEYDKRMARQLSPEEKAKRADYVIINNGSLADVRNAVVKIYEEMINKIPRRE